MFLKASAAAAGVMVIGATALAAPSENSFSVSAKQLRRDARSCVTTYSGQAELLVPGTAIRGERIEVFGEPATEPGPACGAPERAEGHGSVVLLTPSEEISGYHAAVYDFRSGVIEAQGGPVTIRSRAPK